MIRVLSLFSGIGAFEKALGNLGIGFELVNYCEIDKYASKSYAAIHGVAEDQNLWDVTKIDAYSLGDFDLMTWGFPCQDISVAGRMEGLGGGTRSGLYRDGLRILEAKRPKISVFENVKNLVSKKFKAEFDDILKDLEGLGYTNYWKVLNAKDHGVPQNRERVFCVSIQGEHNPMAWSVPFDNGIRLVDVLEGEVDEKYYIGGDRVDKLLSQLDLSRFNGISGITKTTCKPRFIDVASCVETRDRGIHNERVGMGTAILESAMLMDVRTEYGKAVRSEYENKSIIATRKDIKGLSIRSDGLSGVLSTALRKDNMLIVPCLTPSRTDKRQKGRRFKTDGEPMFTLTGQDRHGVLQIGNIVDTGNFENSQRGRIYSADGLSPTLPTGTGGGHTPKIIDDTYAAREPRIYEGNSPAIRVGRTFNVLNGVRIRKLTPLECFRLMGFDDNDYWKAKLIAGSSNTQLYKQAGNSIVVQVLEGILRGIYGI